MCEAKVSGIMPGWATGRGRRRQSGECKCHETPGKTPTEKAQVVLAWVGGLFAMSAVGTGAAGHALGLGVEVILIALAVLAALAAAGAGWWLVRRVRSLREPDVMPAPAISWRPRTMVTGVTVQAAIEQAARSSAARAAARSRAMRP